MKTSEYFKFTRVRQDRADIRMEWIEHVIQHPVKKEIQGDGRLRLWAKIKEADDKYLRVILLEDHETIHNAFFDRRFQET